MDVKRKILISKLPWETRIAVMEEKLVEYHWETEENALSYNTICGGVVEKILPALQTAFISLPNGETGYLFVSEIPGRVKRIEDVLKEGQKVIVQIIREKIENKKARVSMKIKIPGLFLVGIPFLKGIKVSHKIESEPLKEKLKRILKEYGSRMGFIIRTAASIASEEMLINEAEEIIKLWEKISLPIRKEILYTEPPLYIRIIREFLGKGQNEVIVDSKEIFDKIAYFLQKLPPNHGLHLRLHNDEISLFQIYGVKTELERALRKKVWLKNGGYILIEEMEGFTGIDVNTGRFRGLNSFEESAFITNALAAEEIARQVRLRNIGGIIVIDFIDMESKEKKEQLISILREELKRDRARISLPEKIEKFGIVSFTREKDEASFSKKINVSCPICGGRGGIFSSDFIIKEAFEELLRNPLVKRRNPGQKITAIIKFNPKDEQIKEEDYSSIIESIRREYNVNVVLEPTNIQQRYEIVWKIE
jgi:ribonuclease G